MNMTELYRGFIISWQEPPQTSAYWTANVASDDPRLYNLMVRNGSEVIVAPSRSEMIDKSKKYIDSLF